MKKRLISWILGTTLLGMGVLASAHEKTGWIAPEDAKKMKNPVKAVRLSLQKGKEIYEKKCALCHGEKGDGKGPVAAGLNPKPTDFRESHGEKMTDGEHFWKITTGRGVMPPFEKELIPEERWHVINYIKALTRRSCCS